MSSVRFEIMKKKITAMEIYLSIVSGFKAVRVFVQILKEKPQTFHTQTDSCKNNGEPLKTFQK